MKIKLYNLYYSIELNFVFIIPYNRKKKHFIFLLFTLKQIKPFHFYPGVLLYFN